MERPPRKSARVHLARRWLPDWSTANLVRETLRELQLVDDVITLINGFCKQQVVLIIGGYKKPEDFSSRVNKHGESMTLLSPEPTALKHGAVEVNKVWPLTSSNYQEEERTVCVIGQRLYKFNDTTDQLDVLDLDPTALSVPSIAWEGKIYDLITRGPIAVNQSIYLFCTNRLTADEGQPYHYNEGIPRVLVYHTDRRDAWAVKSTCPMLPYSCPTRAVAVKNSIYVLEESEINPSAAMALLYSDEMRNDKLYEYATETDTWTKLQSRPGGTFKYGYASDAIGGFLYVCGGTTRWRNSAGGHMASCDRYNIEKGRWEKMPPLLFPRCSPMAAFADNTLLVMGGIGVRAHDGMRDDCERWDAQLDKWVLLPHIVLPHKMMGAATVVL